MQSGERRVIKERGGRGRARAVLINFFPFLTYIYIYLFLSFYLRFRNLFFRKEREGGRETSRINSISCELSHSIIAILRITRAPFNENLYYLMKRARRVASNRSKTIPCSATKQHHENDFWQSTLIIRLSFHSFFFFFTSLVRCSIIRCKCFSLLRKLSFHLATFRRWNSEIKQISPPRVLRLLLCTFVFFTFSPSSPHSLSNVFRGVLI